MVIQTFGQYWSIYIWFKTYSYAHYTMPSSALPNRRYRRWIVDRHGSLRVSSVHACRKIVLGIAYTRPVWLVYDDLRVFSNWWYYWNSFHKFRTSMLHFKRKEIINEPNTKQIWEKYLLIFTRTDKFYGWACRFFQNSSLNCSHAKFDLWHFIATWIATGLQKWEGYVICEGANAL